MSYLIFIIITVIVIAVAAFRHNRQQNDDDVFDLEMQKVKVNQPTPPRQLVDGRWTELYQNVYHTKIAGINFRKGIKNLAGTYFDARIEEDQKNKYDKNAIKIVKADDGRHLGFIPADETGEVRRFINNDFTCHCRVFIEEGEDWDYDLDREKRFLYGYVNIYNNKQNVSPI